MKEKRRNKGVQNQADRKSNSPSKETKAGKTKVTAPYNFIPLNETIVEAQERPDCDCYHMGNNDIKRFNGYIECQLENLTHLYIRDTYTDEELLKKEATKEDNKDNPEFFSPGGIVRIPGSSLRGMIRNLVEIMSWGKFGPFEDKRLFYRAIASNSSLDKEYQRNMSSKDKLKNSKYKFNAGYLKKEGFNYYIIPAKIKNGTQFKQIAQKDKNKSFVVEKQENNKYLVISGHMNNKKHDWLINEPDFTKKIAVSNIDIKEYMLDESRYDDKSQKDDNNKRDGNLFRLISISNDNMTPCFYVKWKDQMKRDRISFGHTGFFRLAYKNTIGDHIPKELKENEVTDIAEAIFGKLSEKNSFASRVFFEDAFLEPGQRNFLSEHPLTPQILSTPKPTTFQHYLEQEPNGSLNHWNTRDKKTRDKKIRGNKLYWHRNVEKWEKNSSNNKKLLTQIKPLKPYTKFRFKIRFENLSEVELGAILYALNLPNNCRHKLGMGKPLGLGSVKITPKLFLTNRESRYTMLFEDDSWFLATEEVELGSFKRVFEKYILSNIEEEVLSLWDVERMKHLKTMLDFSKDKTWNEKTKYMTVKDFKNRPVLPKPLDIKEI